jgi:glutamyl-Q tRNA(Asp) synthetase
MYLGRFAPSPTGLLHAGSLVAALASWLDARQNGGQWLVRIEDVDSPRCVNGAAEGILRQLAACHLFADAAVLYQSQRSSAYQKALDLLVAKGWAYPCACSRKEIEDAQGQRPRHSTAVYPGTCRDGLHGKPPRAWRLNVQQVDRGFETPTALGLARQVSWAFSSKTWCNEVGDFVLLRADGLVGLPTRCGGR